MYAVFDYSGVSLNVFKQWRGMHFEKGNWSVWMTHQLTQINNQLDIYSHRKQDMTTFWTVLFSFFSLS